MAELSCGCNEKEVRIANLKYAIDYYEKDIEWVGLAQKRLNKVIDKREAWHPLFNNRKYRILEKNYFVDYQHEYILEPCIVTGKQIGRASCRERV